MTDKAVLNILLELSKENREDMKDVKDNIGEIHVVQAEQALILEEHQKASGGNSQRLTHLEDVIIPKLVAKLEPKPIEWKKCISWGLGSLLTISMILGVLWKNGIL